MALGWITILVIIVLAIFLLRIEHHIKHIKLIIIIVAIFFIYLLISNYVFPSSKIINTPKNIVISIYTSTLILYNNILDSYKITKDATGKVVETFEKEDDKKPEETINFIK